MTTATETTIRDALLCPAVLDGLRNSFRRQVCWIYGQLVDHFGPSLDGVRNHWTHAKAFESIKDCLRWELRRGAPVLIDEALLTARAAEYAEATALQWLAKITAKLGPVQNASVQWLGAGNLITIHAFREGKLVEFNQEQILKASPRGKLHNQFPSRLYVDGKFVSEAVYRMMFKE